MRLGLEWPSPGPRFCGQVSFQNLTSPFTQVTQSNLLLTSDMALFLSEAINRLSPSVSKTLLGISPNSDTNPLNPLRMMYPASSKFVVIGTHPIAIYSAIFSGKEALVRARPGG